MATQKLTNFDFFLTHADMWLPEYNLTKLFWMKLKTPKSYENHLTEKKNQMNFLANPY